MCAVVESRLVWISSDALHHTSIRSKWIFIDRLSEQSCRCSAKHCWSSIRSQQHACHISKFVRIFSKLFSLTRCSYHSRSGDCACIRALRFVGHCVLHDCARVRVRRDVLCEKRASESSVPRLILVSLLLSENKPAVQQSTCCRAKL
jgi:hypothetical protein